MQTFTLNYITGSKWNSWCCRAKIYREETNHTEPAAFGLLCIGRSSSLVSFF